MQSTILHLIFIDPDIDTLQHIATKTTIFVVKINVTSKLPPRQTNWQIFYMHLAHKSQKAKAHFEIVMKNK